ncbi:NepR family anti-sigma factor [Methylocystis sp. IM3]|uniref:NepR family anti-sigma factor n=1 Tax=unclassified Methylocystis TaxID=2625913 RepID=UPI000F944A7F|nr:MAG: hypothetical protein EKK29_18245 [Hyphomicrobiales bacterium]
MTTIASEDAALIEREIGNELKSYYGKVVREPLPDRIQVLLKELAAREGRRGVDDRDGSSAVRTG